MIKKFIPITLIHKIKSILYYGDRYFCPLCNYSSKDLKKIGFDIEVLRQKEVIGGGHRNAGCPICDSTDRERLVYTYLSKKLNIFKKSKDLKILHLAPERSLSRVLFSFGFNHYICGDLYTEGYSYPDYVQNMNVLDIPYEDNYFDVILCNHLLEHVPDDLNAMKELYRVLAKGGKAILQVPISKNSDETFEDFSITDPKEREAVFGQYDHVRIYGQDYVQRLTSAGFVVERTNISGEFPKYGLATDEDIFIGNK
jgi:SAM-dependent methyltransferase